MYMTGLLTANPQRMHAFNQSLKYDQRMHDADIRGSIAYAKSLALVGILTKDEEFKIIQGLTAVGKEWKSGQVGFISS
jgi:argininosuccinate lyase